MPIVYKYIQCFYNLKFSDIKFVFIFPLLCSICYVFLIYTHSHVYIFMQESFPLNVFFTALDRHMLIEDDNLIENIKFDEGKFPSKH